jgi:hypothetical protein
LWAGREIVFTCGFTISLVVSPSHLWFHRLACRVTDSPMVSPSHLSFHQLTYGFTVSPVISPTHLWFHRLTYHFTVSPVVSPSHLCFHSQVVKLSQGIPESAARVELVVSLFSRILDLENFHTIMYAMEIVEQALLIRRLGTRLETQQILNPKTVLKNPVKPLRNMSNPLPYTLYRRSSPFKVRHGDPS